MKKILFVPIIFFILLIGVFNFSAKNQPNIFDTHCLAKPAFSYHTENSNSDSLISLLLYDDIDKAIQDYFGKPTQFALYDAKITKISQIDNEFSYKVTIEVPSFNGPHNPPYGLEILTFTISPGECKLESYTHKSLPN